MSQINGTGLVPMLQTVNDNLMFGYFGVLTLITLFVMFFMGFVVYTNDPKKSVGYASLFVAILSVFFRGLELVNDTAVLIAWLILAISTALLFLTGK